MRSLFATLALLSSAAAGAPLTDPVDLATLASPEAVRILGARAGDEAGRALAPAGDWNGDGRPDLLIGSPFALDPGGTAATGLAHVVFGGGAPPAALDLGALGGRGTVIVGEAALDRCGTSVAGIGDWNSDGRDDIAIGAPFSTAGHGTETGRVYLLFGRASPPAQINLDGLAPGDGVVITGGSAAEQTGFAVAGAGDWNGDGVADLAIGAPNADYSAIDAGRAYVVLGRVSPPAQIDLALVQPTTVTIDGAHDSGTVPIINLFGDSAGLSLAGGADLTGDGVDDLLVNAPGGDVAAGSNAGITYILPGSPTPPASIALISPPVGVRRIEGAHTDDQGHVFFDTSYHSSFGAAVALTPDLDGDGAADLGIGSQFADPGGDSSGIVHVVRGGAGLPAVLSLAALRSGDVAIWGEGESDILGRAVASAGDFNGDGVGDLVVGAPQANPLGRLDAGSATVLLGSPQWPSVFDLPDIGPFGLRVFGALAGDLAGLAATGIGDWNGDGFDDVAISSPGATAGPGRVDSGVVTVLLGQSLPIVFTHAEAWELYR